MNKFTELWDNVEDLWDNADDRVKALIILGIIVGAILILVGAGFLGLVPFFVVLSIYALFGLYRFILYLIEW